MTRALKGTDVAARIHQSVPGAVIEATEQWTLVRPQELLSACRFLRDNDELDCSYLLSLTGVDFEEYFDVVYHLLSLAKNHALVLRTRLSERENPEVPSVVSLWVGAQLQEREVYDLMGIRFVGHPDLRRILLWEGFPGHPLRKDYLRVPGGYSPGWPYFPGEGGRQADPAWKQPWRREG